MARNAYTKFADGLEFELRQLNEEGRVIPAEFEEAVKATLSLEDGKEKDDKAIALFEQAQTFPYIGGKNEEPDDLPGIFKLAPGAQKTEVDKDSILDKVYGGWLARCAGCLLGKPVEGWRSYTIEKLAKYQNNFPLTKYLTSDGVLEIGTKDGLHQGAMVNRAFIDNVDGMPEDDDTNYTIIGMKLLEKCGRDFTPEDARDNWLQNLPYYHVFTAERVAYRNLVMNMLPPESASWCNGYREWIGAQIRADFFGYINPGDPMTAADMAWRDASISHVKNGIYGEMWVAAMLATAYVSDNMIEIIRGGLKTIPEKSRLTAAIEDVIAWFEAGLTCDEVMAKIANRWDENFPHDWCHTISNAQIVAAALLFGGDDLTKTLSIAVLPGFDTDCNGATAGSVLGIKLGAAKLPESWLAPMHDTLYSGVDGYPKSSIKALAEKTMTFMK